MQGSLFLLNKLRERFLTQKLSKFDIPISQNVLDIEDKTRSNIFTWRGQFSPQLIESLLFTYCPRNATVLDPFVGSGTVLYEAACFGLQAFGYEVNPAAWILSKIYGFANLESSKRAESLNLVRDKLESYFPRQILFNASLPKEVELASFQQTLSNIYDHASSNEKAIIDASVILLDLANNSLTVDRIHHTFTSLCRVIDNLPYSDLPVTTSLCDARSLPLAEETIDFVVTSPPYINVFNYHQNYRRSAETLGWDLLKIAKSEIGSNRANRANRFFTVIQYCLDMALVLKEMHRVCKSNSRLIFVVGYESNVLGVPFCNSEIISNISRRSGAFELVTTQKRTFKNKFGKNIREDILHLVKRDIEMSTSNWDEIARSVAHEILICGLAVVPDGNKHSLIDAIEKVPKLGKSPILTS
ncbi:MAG: site-specific DNA-methyltransferase [Desmonostoc vinosum HA7617-LM4]|jgi:DNA modification methylase|nr:site-specific DNA-methyltransferase [Desmonostoc vinosum HA7617-LM4]